MIKAAAAADGGAAKGQQRSVGDNEPYDGALTGDTIDRHCTARGLANALIEVRQDLIGDDVSAHAMAERLFPLLQEALTAPGLATICHYPGRTLSRSARR